MLAPKCLRALIPTLASLAVLAPSGPAFADTKYNRKTRDIKVEQTEATKKMAPKQEEPEKRAPDASFTADQFMQVETAVQDIHDALIEQYKEALEEANADDPRRPEYAFRLGEAFAQKQRYYHFRQMEALTKADAAAKSAEKDKWLKEAKKHRGQEEEFLKKAVVVYKTMADNTSKIYRNFARMDEVLFYYGFTLMQGGYTDPALEQYKRLLKEYQNSRFIPDAYLAFAERYFEAKDMSLSEQFYTKVLQYPQSSVFPYAMYKRGWVYFNLQRFDDAMRAFFDTVQLTRDEKKHEPMNKAAKKDYVRMFAEVGDVKLAYKAFERVDAVYAFKMLSFLGEFYIDQGKAEKAIYVYREMIGLDPANKDVCDWESTVVRAALTIGKPVEKVKEIENLAKLFKHVRDNKVIPEAKLQECRDNAQSVTSELAKLWHVEGLKTLNPETLALSHQLYSLYQEYYPDADDAAEMQFNYAELIWKRAEMEKNGAKQAVLWEEAATAYTRVVQAAAVDKKLLKEAAYATVLAWKNALAIDPSTDVPDDDKETDAVPQPLPIPEKEQKMMAAFDVYLTYVTDRKDDERTQITFFKGRIYWKYRHYDEAIPYLAEVIDVRPDHEVAEFSANVLLDALNRAQRYDDLIKLVDKLLGMDEFMKEHADLAQRVEHIKRQSMRKRAEKLEKDGSYRECGHAYDDIYKRYSATGGDDLAELLYNAAVCFEKARLVGRAIAYRLKLTGDFPKNSLAQKAQYSLGLNYASVAMYEKAAEMFEAYAAKFGGEKDASGALSTATFFRKGLGQDDKAIKDTESFIKQYGGKLGKEAASAHYSMASIYEKQKAFDKFTVHLGAFLKSWGQKGGVDRQIAAHVKIGEVLWRESCPVKGVSGACIDIQRERALKGGGKRKKKGDELPTQCGPESKSKITVHDRKKDLVKQAQGHFNAALKLWNGGKAAEQIAGKDDAEKAVKTAEAIHWTAAASFYLAEEKYEEFLRVKFPQGLDFDEKKPGKKKESENKFNQFLADKTKAVAAAKDRYMTVVNDAVSGGIKINGAAWAISSAARVGQLYQNYSDALFTAEVPKDLREGEFAEDAVAAFCDALTEQADPLEQQSVDAYSFCLDTSTKLNWFNDWTKVCEGELAQIRPQDFPTAGELRSAPDEVPMTLDSQSITAEIEASASSSDAGGRR